MQWSSSGPTAFEAPVKQLAAGAPGARTRAPRASAPAGRRGRSHACAVALAVRVSLRCRAPPIRPWGHCCRVVVRRGCKSFRPGPVTLANLIGAGGSVASGGGAPCKITGHARRILRREAGADRTGGRPVGLYRCRAPAAVAEVGDDLRRVEGTVGVGLGEWPLRASQQAGRPGGTPGRAPIPQRRRPCPSPCGGHPCAECCSMRARVCCWRSAHAAARRAAPQALPATRGIPEPIGWHRARHMRDRERASPRRRSASTGRRAGLSASPATAATGEASPSERAADFLIRQVSCDWRGECHRRHVRRQRQKLVHPRNARRSGDPVRDTTRSPPVAAERHRRAHLYAPRDR